LASGHSTFKPFDCGEGDLNDFLLPFPHRKHRSDYPAVKIGRLGVNVSAQHRHIGTDILDFVKQTFITNNRTGCCFVTVDAPKSAVPFYVDNGFKPLRKVNEGETIPMYYDLTQLI